MALTKKNPKLVSLDDEEGGISEWYSKNTTLINWVLAIVLIAVIGWRAFDWMRTTRLERANAAYATVQQSFNTALAETDPEKRRQDLAAVAPQAESVVTNHSNQPVSREALLLAGKALYYQAETLTGAEAIEGFKAAQTAYQRYISAAQTDRDRAVGQLALGNSLENLLFLTADQQYGREALNAYEDVQQKVPGTYLDAEAKMANARVLQALEGRQDEAAKLYQTVAADRLRPEVSSLADDTTLTTQQGQQISPEEIAEIRTLRKNSYETLAQQSLERLKGLPTKPQ